MSAATTLESYSAFAARRENSLARLKELSQALATSGHIAPLQGTIFAAGSYGRLEAGPASDLDLFVVEAEEQLGPLAKVRLLGAIADINDSLKFPPVDAQMRFFKVYAAGELIKHTGKPIDDSENSFTARMLLLLEGRQVFGAEPHSGTVESIAANYFRDNTGKKNFRPLFLLNDLLRYWRTLCLNYEDTRSDPGRKWRKKNLNLRFSRMTTVFSTVGVLLQFRPKCAAEFLPFVSMTPIERLATTVDEGADAGLISGFREFIEHYEWFLSLKDSKGAEQMLDGDLLLEARERADQVGTYFYEVLTQKSFGDFSRYLML